MHNGFPCTTEQAETQTAPRISLPSINILALYLFWEDGFGGRLERSDHVLFDEAEGTREVLLEPSQVHLGFLVVGLWMWVCVCVCVCGGGGGGGGGIVC